MNDTQHNNRAREAIRNLLGGRPPGGAREEYGGWADTIDALKSALAAGGTAQARATFNALAKANPELMRLVASGPEPVKTSWTAAELLETDFPEPTWAVPGVIPVGLSVLAGRPKVGKSWLALQIAGAVGTGGVALDRRVEKGRVLYLALEDGPQRLKSRLQKQNIPKTEEIRFETSWPNLIGGGGLIDLQVKIEQGGYNLVVIDTLSRALGKADQQDVAEMTTILGNLQRFAQLYNLAILLIDHHRKPSGLLANPIDDVLGSTAKTAVADAALGLFREQGKHGATLRVTGRDLEDLELALEWDGLTCCWQVLGEAGQVRKESLQADILAAIQELDEMGELPTTMRIAQHLGKDKGNISRSLAELVRAGQVIKGQRVGREQPYLLQQ